MELVTKRDMNDARRLMIHCDIRHIEGAEYLIHDVAQFIADGRRPADRNAEIDRDEAEVRSIQRQST